MDEAVFVISKNGERLMPTTRRGKVRHLLKEGKAKIYSHQPFTIQLLYETTTYTQPIEYCEDTGDHNIGVSIKSEKREYASHEIHPLLDEKEMHDSARKLRRTRRSRLRYRKPRFNNRKKGAGWIPPSLEHKKDVNLYWFEKYCEVCPITSAYFEIGRFDTQRLQAIEEGKELPEGKDYQKGPRSNYHNLREAVFSRDNYRCVICGRGVKEGAILHEHHALYWQGRHGNQLNELMTVCEKCHTPANHKKGGKLWGQMPPNKFKNMQGAATMNVLRKRIIDGARKIAPNIPVYETYGSYTKASREHLGLEKSHVNDAYSMGKFHPKTRARIVVINKRRRNNRILEKFYDAKYIDTRDGKAKAGHELFNGRTKRNKSLNCENLHKYRGHKKSKGKRAVRRKRYAIRPCDVVKYEGKQYIARGVQSNGTRVLLDDDSKYGKSVAIEKVKVLKHINGWQFLPALTSADVCT